MKTLAALCAVTMFATAVHAREAWPPFVFGESIDPITDAVSWAVISVTTTGKAVKVGCASDEPDQVVMSFRDGAIHSNAYGATMLTVRFDKDTPLEFFALNPTGQGAYIIFGGNTSFPRADVMRNHVSYKDVPKILDGLRTRTTMAFQIMGNTPVIVPLNGSTVAMAKLDAKWAAARRRR